MNAKILACGLILLGSAVAYADIPRPDGIVYGRLLVGEQVARASDGHTIVAMVDGREEPISVYQMGNNPGAGDRYVLHIPHAVADDGRTPSTNTPLPSAVVKIYVQDTSGGLVHAGEATIPESGKTRELDLYVAPEDLGAGYPLDNSSANACGSGGGMCGTVGLICPFLMLCGLFRMKLRLRR